MRLLKYIDEEWVNTRSGEKQEIIDNPSKKEMDELASKSGMLRFIADNDNETLWIFSPHKLIHIDVWSKIPKLNKGVDWTNINLTKYLLGKCFKRGSGWQMDSSDKIQYDKSSHDYIQQLYYNSKWLKQYMNIDKFFKKYL
jgi:hypothetical protein